MKTRKHPIEDWFDKNVEVEGCDKKTSARIKRELKRQLKLSFEKKGG